MKTPWVFVTNRSAGAEAHRAFAAGAADYVNKPVSADLLVAKLRTILEREAGSKGRRGVSGSLAEMSLPEMVQVLWHGRKTGALKIRAGTDAGEIHFVAGNVYNALWQNLRASAWLHAPFRAVPHSLPRNGAPGTDSRRGQVELVRGRQDD